MDKFPNYRRHLHNYVCRHAELEVMGDELQVLNFIRIGKAKRIERFVIGYSMDGRHIKWRQVEVNGIKRNELVPNKYWYLALGYGPFIFIGSVLRTMITVITGE